MYTEWSMDPSEKEESTIGSEKSEPGQNCLARV
jgi:hypothetical protein